MREFFYKLAKSLKAPLWLRAHPAPAETAVATSIPVVPEIRSFAEEIAADLAELGIELFPKPPKPTPPKKLGFFRALADVHRYWRRETEEPAAAVAVTAAAVVAVAAVAVAVTAAAAVAVTAAAVVAATVAVTAAAVVAATVAVTAAAAAVVAAAAGSRGSLVFAFYCLLVSTTLLLFTPVPWWADLLLPLLVGSWLAQALWRMVRSRRRGERLTETPTPPLTAEQLYNRVVKAVTTAIESHRTQVIEGDSALKGVIAAQEKDRETLKRVRDELEVLAQGDESPAYVNSRLAEAEAGIAELEQGIARATSAKEEFLARLRRLEAHLPTLNRFVVRRRIDETIVRIRAKAADFARETDAAFLKELRSLSNDVAPLLAALERLTHALMGADETLLLEQMFEEVERLAEVSGKADKLLSA